MTDRNAILEEAAQIADNYARNGRTYRELACETADEIAARVRSLKSDEASVSALYVWPNIAAPPQYDDPADGWEDPRLPPFQTIWDIAKAHGYAVGLHGSMKRDVDLIAAPWTETAVSPTVLIEALCASLNARVVGGPEKKPLGRLAATLQIDGWFKPIDISIMPGAPVSDMGHATVSPSAPDGAVNDLWMPIESAPTNGVRVDLWSAENGRIADAIFVDGEWRYWVGDGSEGLDWVKVPGYITHWRLEPPPPATQEHKEGE
jgi:hypothetical protein